MKCKICGETIPRINPDHNLDPIEMDYDDHVFFQHRSVWRSVSLTLNDRYNYDCRDFIRALNKIDVKILTLLDLT